MIGGEGAAEETDIGETLTFGLREVDCQRGPRIYKEGEIYECHCGGRQCCSQGCQMAKFDPFLSLDCARVEGVGAQSKERKGSNFAA